MEDNFPHSRYMRNDTFFKMRRNKIMMKICQNFSKFVIYKITTSRQLLKKTIEPKKPNTEENLRNRNKEINSGNLWVLLLTTHVVDKVTSVKQELIQSDGKTYCFY